MYWIAGVDNKNPKRPLDTSLMAPSPPTSQWLLLPTPPTLQKWKHGHRHSLRITSRVSSQRFSIASRQEGSLNRGFRTLPLWLSFGEDKENWDRHMSGTYPWSGKQLWLTVSEHQCQCYIQEVSKKQSPRRTWVTQNSPVVMEFPIPQTHSVLEKKVRED